MKRMYLYLMIRRLLSLWLCCSMFLLVLMLVQTILGKYDGESNLAWQWYLINLLPGNIIIMVSYFRHKRLYLLTLSGTDIILYNIVLWTSAFYLLALISIILLQPLARYDVSAANNLHAADMGLYIFQVIVMVALGMFIYTTGKRFIVIKKAESKDSLAGEPGVFISYNHADKIVADKLKVMLQAQNISVTIDSKDMLAGQDIKSFIEKSVLYNRTTLSIVSTKSLLSGWVGMETINTFFLQKFSKNRQFIACYLDADFFDLGFTAKAVESFDLQLKDLNAQIEKHFELRIDSRDLNDAKSRLIALRGNLDEIIRHLRGSLCIDISERKLADNFGLILKSINPD